MSDLAADPKISQYL